MISVARRRDATEDYATQRRSECAARDLCDTPEASRLLHFPKTVSVAALRTGETEGTSFMVSRDLFWAAQNSMPCDGRKGNNAATHDATNSGVEQADGTFIAGEWPSSFSSSTTTPQSRASHRESRHPKRQRRLRLLCQQPAELRRSCTTALSPTVIGWRGEKRGCGSSLRYERDSRGRHCLTNSPTISMIAVPSPELVQPGIRIVAATGVGTDGTTSQVASSLEPMHAAALTREKEEYFASSPTHAALKDVVLGCLPPSTLVPVCGQTLETPCTDAGVSRVGKAAGANVYQDRSPCSAGSACAGVRELPNDIVLQQHCDQHPKGSYSQRECQLTTEITPSNAAVTPSPRFTMADVVQGLRRCSPPHHPFIDMEEQRVAQEQELVKERINNHLGRLFQNPLREEQRIASLKCLLNFAHHRQYERCAERGAPAAKVGCGVKKCDLAERASAVDAAPDPTGSHPTSEDSIHGGALWGPRQLQNVHLQWRQIAEQAECDMYREGSAFAQRKLSSLCLFNPDSDQRSYRDNTAQREERILRQYQVLERLKLQALQGKSPYFLESCI